MNDKLTSLVTFGYNVFWGYAGVRAGEGNWAFRSKHAQSACSCLPTPRTLECIVSGKSVTRWPTANQQRKTCERVLSDHRLVNAPSRGHKCCCATLRRSGRVLWWITCDIQLPGGWATVGCLDRSLMRSSVKYSRAATFYRRHEYSVCLICERTQLFAGVTVAFFSSSNPDAS